MEKAIRLFYSTSKMEDFDGSYFGLDGNIYQLLPHSNCFSLILPVKANYISFLLLNVRFSHVFISKFVKIKYSSRCSILFPTQELVSYLLESGLYDPFVLPPFSPANSDQLDDPTDAAVIDEVEIRSVLHESCPRLELAIVQLARYSRQIESA